MKSKNPCCRRSFLKKGLAVSAGLSLLGAGVKSITTPENVSLPEDEWRWVAFCTQECNTCSTYQSGGCWSCKSAQGLQGSCSKKRCAIDVKNVPTCAHCDELDTCSEYDDWPALRAQAQELRDSLNVSTERAVNKDYGIKIYPSPSTESIRIVNTGMHKGKYEFIDLSGKVHKEGMLDSPNQLLNVSNHSQGIYTLRISNNSKIMLSQKVMISH